MMIGNIYIYATGRYSHMIENIINLHNRVMCKGKINELMNELAGWYDS